MDAIEDMQENTNASDKKKHVNEERKRHRTFFNRAAQSIINTEMRGTEKVIEKYYTSRPQLSPKEDLDTYEERFAA